MELTTADYLPLVEYALSEDIGPGDITTDSLIEHTRHGRAKIIAREDLILCGMEVAQAVFVAVDRQLRVSVVHTDGSSLKDNDVACYIEGPLHAILKAERTALNFIQRLSGIATQTAELVRKVASYNVRLLDTRKTTPGWRSLEKYAVFVGGGANHRFGLYDAVLIKNNHVDSIDGDLRHAVRRCRERTAPGTKIEVEVRSIEELQLALEAAPDAILLDNMTPQALTNAVQQARQSCPNIELEASGGVNQENLCAYAASGVDSISLGALTHSVHAVDLSLRYIKEAE